MNYGNSHANPHRIGAGTAHNLTGTPLPEDFHRRNPKLNSMGGLVMDQRDWKEVFDRPRWSAKPPASPNLIQGARLTPPSWREIYGDK